MLRLKKFMSLALVLVLAFAMTACGSSSDGTSESGDSETTTSEDLPSITDLTLGEDYTDLSADIYFITHKTDIVDTTFKEYAAEFNEMYPNINITFEGITDYANDMTVRLTTDNWGDVCMIPTTLDKSELSNLFISYGENDDLSASYDFLDNFTYQDEVYGIPSTANAQGIVYNKKVFEDAGITELPTTPDEFLADLQQIKDNTDAIPLYTNFAAGWTMTAWDAYIGGGATGDPDFMNRTLLHMQDPFSKTDDMTGPYAVYYTLYNAAADGLIEDDPTTTDWESSKTRMNNGEIATMVLGSWAITQIQEAGDNADDIAYMPFPITVDGKQYASAGPDYNYGINSHVSTDEQIASMLFVKWMVEESNYSYDQGGLPIVVGGDYPDTLTDFADVDMVIDSAAVSGEETLFNDLNNESELGINSDPGPKQSIVEAALSGSETIDQIMDEWNEKWSEAQEKEGVDVTE